MQREYLPRDSNSLALSNQFQSTCAPPETSKGAARIRGTFPESAAVFPCFSQVAGRRMPHAACRVSRAFVLSCFVLRASCLKEERAGRGAVSVVPSFSVSNGRSPLLVAALNSDWRERGRVSTARQTGSVAVPRPGFFALTYLPRKVI